MEQQVRAFWIAAPGRGEIRTESLSPPAHDEVIVRTVYSAISRGTEALVFNGEVPPSEWVRMRAPFQQGEFPAPVKYGYANVGIVESGPSAVVGRAAFVLYPHQTRYTVPFHALHLLPDDVPPARAVLAANLETAITGLWDARPCVGDRIAVIGAGTVGCLLAWAAARIVGCEVELVDTNPQRAAIAAALGVRFASPATAAHDADLVLHASGAPDGLRLALDLAGTEATIVEMSWFGAREVPLPLGGPFHARRLTIAASQVGTVPLAQRARWTTGRRMQLALRLLREPALDVLINSESDFDDLPQVMATLAAAPGDTLCHRLRYKELQDV